MNPLPPDVEMLLDGLRRVGDQWIARCPAHDDHRPSLTLRVTDEGKLVVYCHAGCEQRAVLDALGYEPPERGEWTPHGPAIAVYDYRDESGQLLFQVLRAPGKRFLQRRPESSQTSGWAWNLQGVRRVLFRLPELVAAVAAGRSVCITEGEKDALALVDLGCTATCNSGGAGKWRSEYAEHFRDAHVTIFADKDKPGQAHARQVAASLTGVAASWKIVEAADPHKDIAEHLAAGNAPADVVVTSTSDAPAKPDLAPELFDLLESVEPDYDWLVEGLLERGDRMILTGSEGCGKTMLLRQLAVMLASGVHPITFAEVLPLRVLVIDCENSSRLNRRAYRPMVDAMIGMGRRHEYGNLRLAQKPEGIELESPNDAAWLLERVTAHHPDVLVLGPLYRLHVANPKDEDVARRVTQAIDAARTAVNCAVLMEAHAPQAEPGRGRSLRPLGSSLYLRWPEFGLGLRVPSGADDEEFWEVSHWRGDRDRRSWPPLLRRTGQLLPWEPSDWAIFHERQDGQHLRPVGGA